jgi:hypothetical protein
MVAMAFIGTVHADSPAKLQYWEQMKAMIQAADGGSLGHSQSRAAAVVTFVVDVSAGFRSGQSRGVTESRISDRSKSFSVDLERQGAHVCGERACWLLTDKHIGASEKHLLKTMPAANNRHDAVFELAGARRRRRVRVRSWRAAC